MRSPTNDTFYVGSAHFGGISTFELQEDNTLIKTDVITTGMSLFSNRRLADKVVVAKPHLSPPDDHPVDNLSIDSNGALWANGNNFTSLSIM